MPSAKIISNKTNAISLSGTPYKDLISKIPSIVNKVLIFELTEANCAIANAIRRTLMSEMPIKHLTVSLSDINTTDPYIIGESIRKRIEMIPISQSIHEDSVFSIRFENNSDEYVDIMSSEIKLNGVASSKDITPSIPICDINSNTSFSMNDIHVVESYGYNNSRVSIGRVGYEIINQDFTQSSLISNPTDFRIEIETAGIMDPKNLVCKAIDELIERLDLIDYQRSVIEFGVFKLTIRNETHSIGNLLCWYVYQLDTTIKYVAKRILHPSERVCVLDILHPNAESICKQAAEVAKKDLSTIRKSFA